MKVSPSDLKVFLRALDVARFHVLKVLCQRVSFGKEPLSILCCDRGFTLCETCFSGLTNSAAYTLGVSPDELEQLQAGNQITLLTVINVKRAVGEWMAGRVTGVDLQ